MSLKQRGTSVSPDQASRLLAVCVANPHLSAADAAHALESRVDAVLSTIDAMQLARREPARVVSLLEALGTRAARQRLVEIVDARDQRASLPFALAAIGRMALRSAETSVLARLDDEPEAVLDCLLQIGDEATLAELGRRLAAPEGIFRARRAAQVMLALAPSPELVRRFRETDLLDASALGAISSASDVARSPEIEQIAATSGHPLRADAIRLVARSGGPLAIGFLSRFLTDGDSEIRECAVNAIRTLSVRLAAMESSRPACLRSTSDPASAGLAEAVLGRLVEPGLGSEALGWLLDSLDAQHPQLVSIVRPLLRHPDAEVRKRAARCLVKGGPRAATWLMPWLSDDDPSVVRQALLALGELGASFAGARVAEALDHPNMNLKKTAASALAQMSARSAVSKLLYWLGTHDNWGFRELLVQALRTTLGDFFAVVVLGAAARARAERTRELLLSTLAPPLGPAEVAGILAAHPNSDLAALGPTLNLDAELRRRGLAHRIRTSSASLDPREWQQVEAERNAAELRRAVHLLPESLIALSTGLRRAGKVGQVRNWALSLRESHTLLELYPELDPAAQQGALAVLERAAQHPTVAVRLAELLSTLPLESVPTQLALRTTARWTPETARFWLLSSVAAVRSAAAKVLLAAGQVEPLAWPSELMNELVRGLIVVEGPNQQSAFLRGDPKRWRAALLVVRELEGPSAAQSLWRETSEIHAAELLDVVPKLFRHPEAEWLQVSRNAAQTAAAREAARRLLLGSSAISGRRTLLRELLDEGLGEAAERAALVLCQHGTRDDLEGLVARVGAGEFREDFSLPLRRFEPPRESFAAGAPADRSDAGARGGSLSRSFLARGVARRGSRGQSSSAQRAARHCRGRRAAFRFRAARSGRSERARSARQLRHVVAPLARLVHRQRKRLACSFVVPRAFDGRRVAVRSRAVRCARKASHDRDGSE
ncbi:MAG: HEAT repeat domain-containing protein [Polyangiaceae bacterium]